MNVILVAIQQNLNFFNRFSKKFEKILRYKIS